MNELNPYSPSDPSTRLPVASPEIAQGPSLHRGLSTVVGLSFGVYFSVFVVLILPLIAMKVGFIDRSGVRSLYAAMFFPLFAIAGGILGGLTCGLTIGGRRSLALALASLPGIVYLIAGLLANEKLIEVGLVAVTMAVSAVGGTYECYVLFRGIDRRRNEVFAILKQDPTASPGTAAAFGVRIITACMTIGCIGIALGSLSVIGRSFFTGYMTGVGIIGVLVTLFFWAAYPNHQRLGLVTTLVCVAATCFAFASELFLES